MMTLTPTPQLGLEAQVRAHQEALQWYLHYLGCPRDDIADFAQEAFVRLFRSDRRDLSSRATAAWLRTTVRNLLVSRARQAERRPMMEELEAAEAVWAAHQRDDQGATWRAALRACLGSLSARQRDAVELRHAKKLSRGAIAERLGLRLGGVKILLERTRRALRECIEGRLAHG